MVDTFRNIEKQIRNKYSGDTLDKMLFGLMHKVYEKSDSLSKKAIELREYAEEVLSEQKI